MATGESELELPILLGGLIGKYRAGPGLGLTPPCLTQEQRPPQQIILCGGRNDRDGKGWREYQHIVDRHIGYRNRFLLSACTRFDLSPDDGRSRRQLMNAL